jgi:hypothetical protein
MFGLAAFFAGGFAASLATIVAVTTATVQLREPPPTSQTQTIDRSAKGDRQAFAPTARSHPKRAVATVEVVGVRDAAIVYRDRDGRVLFSTDPVANVTVIAKDALLPELTIRETPATPVSRLRLKENEPPVRARRNVAGCEPAVGGTPGPGAAMLPAVCLTTLTDQHRVAAAN